MSILNFYRDKVVYQSFLLAILLAVYGCGNSQKPTDISLKTESSIKGKNYLSMKINGKDWIADNDIFGAFHPKGYYKAIIIAGSKGKKDKNEQTFNINLYNTNGNNDLNVAQLGNLSADNYLCGSMMGFEMKVNVTKASSIPDIVEATFEGKMTCPSGETLIITEGTFYYHENNF
jgi:hypothetical protein